MTEPREPVRIHESFGQEIRTALRYERGLAGKVVLALAVVGALILAHIFLFS